MGGPSKHRINRFDEGNDGLLLAPAKDIEPYRLKFTGNRFFKLADTERVTENTRRAGIRYSSDVFPQQKFTAII